LAYLKAINIFAFYVDYFLLWWKFVSLWDGWDFLLPTFHLFQKSPFSSGFSGGRSPLPPPSTAPLFVFFDCAFWGCAFCWPALLVGCAIGHVHFSFARPKEKRNQRERPPAASPRLKNGGKFLKRANALRFAPVGRARFFTEFFTIFLNASPKRPELYPAFQTFFIFRLYYCYPVNIQL
jgi:hypothetical protein